MKKSVCTSIFIVINVIVFLGLSFFGRTEDAVFMLEHGAIYAPLLVEQGEYYRLFTAMFLHFGIQHLMNNMVTLAVTGSRLEDEIGKLRFIIIYFGSGLGGGILSLWWDIRTESLTVSAGASGAIFGIMGALLYIAARNRGRAGSLSGRGLLMVIALNLYNGFSSGGVDNLAHMGGLMAGFLLAALLYHKLSERNAEDILL